MSCLIFHNWSNWERYQEGCSVGQKCKCVDCNKLKYEFLGYNHKFSKWNDNGELKYFRSNRPNVIVIRFQTYKRICEICNIEDMNKVKIADAREMDNY